MVHSLKAGEVAAGIDHCYVHLPIPLLRFCRGRVNNRLARILSGAAAISKLWLSEPASNTRNIVVKYHGEESHDSPVARISFVRNRDGWPKDQSRTTGESFRTNQPASSLVNATRRKPAVELDRTF
jgi:hypothetical protein